MKTLKTYITEALSKTVEVAVKSDDKDKFVKLLKSNKTFSNFKQLGPKDSSQLEYFEIPNDNKQDSKIQELAEENKIKLQSVKKI